MNYYILGLLFLLLVIPILKGLSLRAAFEDKVCEMTHPVNIEIEITKVEWKYNGAYVYCDIQPKTGPKKRLKYFFDTPFHTEELSMQWSAEDGYQIRDSICRVPYNAISD